MTRKQKKKPATVCCPYCGAWINENAAACPACGSDERTGWSGQTYLDGIDLPGEGDYEEAYAEEFGRPEKRSFTPRQLGAALVGALLLCAFLFGLLRTVL